MLNGTGLGTTRLRLKADRWLEKQPRCIRISSVSALSSSVIILCIWGRYFLMPSGSVVGLVDEGTTVALSLLLVAFGSGIALISGLIQLLFLSPRRAGWLAIGLGLFPAGSLYAIAWYVYQFEDITFD